MAKDLLKNNNTINITGTSGKEYNLDKLATENTRTSVDEPLVVQIWEWSTVLPPENPHSKPNPPSPQIGQIWLSRLILPTSDENLAKIQAMEEAV